MRRRFRVPVSCDKNTAGGTVIMALHVSAVDAHPQLNGKALTGSS